MNSVGGIEVGELAAIDGGIDPGEIEIDVALFDCKLDNAPKLARRRLRDLIGEKHQIRAEKDGPAFTTAEYVPGARRAARYITQVTAITVDIDKITRTQWAAIQERLSGFAYVYYTTFSHKANGEDDVRVRLIVPITRPIPAKEWKTIRGDFVLNYVLNLADRAASDASRLMYLPACTQARVDYAEIQYVRGKLLDPDKIQARWGTRNDYLIRRAGQLRAEGLEFEELFEALAKVNQEDCIDESGNSAPLDIAEVRNIANSAMRWAAGDNRTIDVPRNNQGVPIYFRHVVQEILRKDEKYAGKFSYNEFSLQVIFDGQVLTDERCTELEVEIGKRYRYKDIPRKKLEDSVLLEAKRKPFHPIKEYLSGLVWDGKKRIESIPSGLFGCNDEIAAIYLRKWLISGIARVFEPGCKVDTILLLVGKQGLKKSTFFEVLAGKQWHSGTSIDINNKDAYLQIHGTWIYELQEFEGIYKKADITKIRSFLSQSVDRFRPPFERHVGNYPRSVIIGATANAEDILRDPEGSRRTWVVPVVRVIDSSEVARERDQIWAEALFYYTERSDWWLTLEEDTLREDLNERFEDESVDTLIISEIEKSLDQIEAQDSFAGHLRILDVLRKMGHDTALVHRPGNNFVRTIAKVLRARGYIRSRKGNWRRPISNQM